MNVLAFSSSTNNVYIALKKNNNLYTKVVEGKNSGNLLISKIKELFDETSTLLQEIDVFGIDIGPGSFTGIRIGIAAVQGMLFNKDSEIRTFYSSDFIYHSYPATNEKIAVVRKARDNMAYISFFENGESNGTPYMINGEELVKLNDYRFIFSESQHFIKKYNLTNKFDDVSLKADILIDLSLKGEKTDIENLKPLYLQKPVAVETWEEKNSIKLSEDIWN